MFALITFLFFLDINELVMTNYNTKAYSYIIDEQSPVIDSIDQTIKPYLKNFVKMIYYNTDIPYIYDSDK